MIIYCPACKEELELPDGIAFNQHIRCPYCNVKFEYGSERILDNPKISSSKFSQGDCPTNWKQKLLNWSMAHKLSISICLSAILFRLTLFSCNTGFIALCGILFASCFWALTAVAIIKKLRAIRNSTSFKTGGHKVRNTIVAGIIIFLAVFSSVNYKGNRKAINYTSSASSAERQYKKNKLRYDLYKKNKLRYDLLLLQYNLREVMFIDQPNYIGLQLLYAEKDSVCISLAKGSNEMKWPPFVSQYLAEELITTRYAMQVYENQNANSSVCADSPPKLNDAVAFDDGSAMKVYRVKSPKRRIILREDRIDVKKGLCAGYEWGSRKRDGKNEMVVSLNGQLGWDDVILFYGKGGNGLSSFTLTKHSVRMDELSAVIKKLTGPWVRSSGKTDLVSFVKGNSSITILLPHDDLRILAAVKGYADGKKADVNFSIVNEEIEKSEKDIEDVLTDGGWTRQENSEN